MSIFTPSLDDIVFEGRNQAYGAYQLRQGYQRHLASAGSITLGICLLLGGAWRLWPATAPSPIAPLPTTTEPLTLTEVIMEKPKLAAEAPARLPHRAAAPPAPTLPTRVAKDEAVPPIKPVVADVAPADALAALTTTGPGNADATNQTGGSNEVAEPAATAGEAEEFSFVEKMPEFAGGQAALLRYLRDHLRYPSQALREQAEGRVFMSFVVRADGAIADVTVLKGLGYGLDEEALRVVKQMPAWTPGYQAKHAVAVRFTLPISFKIQ